MSITTYDQLIAALARAQVFDWNKATIATQAAGGYTSLWLGAGSPLAGTIPTTVTATCTNSLTGTWPFQAGGTLTTYLGRLVWSGATQHTLFLYDRLSHLGGLVGNSTVTQMTASIGIPTSRNAASDGSDVHWFAEIYTAIGTTATSLTINYTNENGSVGYATFITFGGASPAGIASRIYRIIPTTSRYIKSIQSVRLTATTGTAGSFGITCAKLVCEFPSGTPNMGTIFDFAQLGMPVIPDSGCLWLVGLLSAAATGAQQGDLRLIQG